MALSPDGKRLIVSAITANEVQIIDTARGTLAGAFTAGTYPHVLEFTPDETLLTVGSMGNTQAPPGSEGERSLAFVDLASLSVTKRFVFDAGVRPFAFVPDAPLVYVQKSFYNGLIEVNTATGATLRHIDLPVTGPRCRARSKKVYKSGRTSRHRALW